MNEIQSAVRQKRTPETFFMKYLQTSKISKMPHIFQWLSFISHLAAQTVKRKRRRFRLMFASEKNSIPELIIISFSQVDQMPAEQK